MEVAFFKIPQENDFHYYKVFGGPGKTSGGYQEVINFLNTKPTIHIEHNIADSLVGTWCTYEVGITITEKEYKKAFDRAIKSEFNISN